MSDKIEEIKRYINECPFKTLDFRKEDARFLLSEIDTLRARLETAEKVCWQAEQRMFTHEDIWLEEALDNWRKVKESK